jgi:hypothetical protein
MGRDAESPCEIMAAWPSLPPQIVQAIIALVRTVGRGLSLPHAVVGGKMNSLKKCV